MFRKVKTNNFYLYSTEVENFFISDFMIKAPGEYVKAYLLALMFAQLGVAIDNNSLKHQLDMNDDQIEECWSYWEEQGIIKRVNDKVNPEAGYDVEFINLRELIGTAAPEQPVRNESVLDDKEIAKLYKDVQKATGRMIEAREMQEILSWVNDYSISPDLILYCYGYCAQKRKSTSFRYVRTILLDWNKRGIITVDDAENLLAESDNKYSIYKAIFTELGFSRNPTAEEKRLMNSWVDEFFFSLDDIMKACRETAGISSPNLKYVDAVLRNTKGNAADTKQENIAVKINRLYEDIRKQNEERTNRMREKVYATLPRVKEIVKEISEESIKQTQAILKRDQISLNEIKNKIENLKKEKVQLLKAAGFPENATDTIYTCLKCKDTGVLEDGSMCSCYAEKLEQLNGN